MALNLNATAEVGKDIPAEGLVRNYDAVVLAGGSTIPRNLEIPGRELKGIYFAMDFLKQQNKRVSDSQFNQEDILATGKDVIVIGGRRHRGRIAWAPLTGRGRVQSSNSRL